MERQYELALERIQELEEKYMDLKAENELLKDLIKTTYEYVKTTSEIIKDGIM